MDYTRNLRQHYFILATNASGLFSPWLFSKREEGTGFHAAKPFDNVLCSKSKTMMFLATTKGKTVITNVFRVAVLHARLYI